MDTLFSGLLRPIFGALGMIGFMHDSVQVTYTHLGGVRLWLKSLKDRNTLGSQITVASSKIS